MVTESSKAVTSTAADATSGSKVSSSVSLPISQSILKQKSKCFLRFSYLTFILSDQMFFLIAFGALCMTINAHVDKLV